MDDTVKKEGMNIAPLRGRKAQITVFMIIGIILLFSSALVFYIRAQVTEQVAEEMIPEIEEVPLEAQPVKIYVEQCIESTAKDAFKLVGMHGGYLDPEDEAMSGVEFMRVLEPTESEGIELLSPNIFVPYWWYMESPNSCEEGCTFNSLRPAFSKEESPYSVESQIDAYINRELVNCLGDFENFRNQGFEFNIAGEVVTDTRIGDTDTSILVSYPIEVIKDGTSTEITRYFTRLDIDFKSIFNMASDIVNALSNTSAVEFTLMEFITMWSKPLSKDRLPPLAEFTIDPSEFIFWTKTEVQQKIESNVLTPAVGMLQVYGSRNGQRVLMFRPDRYNNKPEEWAYDRLGTAMMDRTLLGLPTNYTTLAATFTYLDWWPSYVNINDKEVLTAERADTPILSFIAGNKYRFFYDISFPVLIGLKDPDAYNGEGYDFFFAVESNIRNNEPASISSELRKVRQGSLVCGLKQRHGANATFEIKNAITGEPIENVRLSLVFGTEGCHLGVTELDENNRTIFRTQLPVGMGQLRVTNLDYMDHSETLISFRNDEINETIELMPYFYINSTIFVRPLSYDQVGKEYVLPPAVPSSPLSPQETAVIMLTRMDNDSFYNYKTAIYVKGNDIMTTKLLPGTYDVRGFLILNESLVIPAEHQTFGHPLFGGEKPIDVNRTEFDTWNDGGVLLNNETGYVEMSLDKLQNSQRLVMYVLRFPKPLTHSTTFRNAPSLEQVGQLTEYSNIYRGALEPQWI